MLMMLTDATRIMCACVERGNAGLRSWCACMAVVGLRWVAYGGEMEHENDGAGRGVTGGSPKTLQLAALLRRRIFLLASSVVI